MKYRDHRGSYNESMRTTREINSVEDIKLHLDKIYKLNGMNLKVYDIKFQSTGIDRRNNWNSHYVLIKAHKNDSFACVGMTDGVPEGGELLP